MMPGNLMLMPHKLAIALQQDGWIVRNDLVWFKRNPMPESVAGWRFENGKLRKSSWRHTRAHEYVFQLVKKMGYHCNQEVVREDLQQSSIDRSKYRLHDFPKQADGYDKDMVNYINPKTADATREKILSGRGRNPRSVLDVPTAPYKGAHYATFPPKLIAPLIRASVPRRCCPECGMAWAPVREKFESGDDSTWVMPVRYETTSTVTDYRPTCECGIEEHEPGIVLDIFGGSGTTGMVAKELMRRWVVMDISRPYLDEQAKVRTGTGTPSKALEGLPMFENEL